MVLFSRAAAVLVAVALSHSLATAFGIGSLHSRARTNGTAPAVQAPPRTAAPAPVGTSPGAHPLAISAPGTPTTPAASSALSSASPVASSSQGQYPIWAHNVTAITAPATSSSSGFSLPPPHSHSHSHSHFPSHRAGANFTRGGLQAPDRCATFGDGRVSVTYSTVFTSTITFTGRPEDFRPTWNTAPDDGNGPPPPCTPEPRFRKGPAILCSTDDSGSVLCPSSTGPTDSQSTPELRLKSSVFVVTARTPAVVYRETPPPNYSLDPTYIASRPGDKNVVGQQSRPPAATQAVQTAAPPPTIPVTNDPTGGVTIGPSTLGGLPAGATTTIVVSGETFTVVPTAVMGPDGAIVSRPGPSLVGFAPVTTSTRVGDLPVEVTSSAVTIAGSTFIIGDERRTAVVGAATVTLGPDGVTIVGAAGCRSGTATATAATATIPFPPIYASPSQIILLGGELMTVVGPSVAIVHSITITYGPALPARTEVVGTDTVVVGPTAVTVRNVTLGGPGASRSGTTYEAVGGVAVTEVGASVVVVASSTFTVGPGASVAAGVGAVATTTMLVGTETVVVGPVGVTVAAVTLTFPLGPTVVSTIIASRDRAATDTVPHAVGGTGTARTEPAHTHGTSNIIGGDDGDGTSGGGGGGGGTSSDNKSSSNSGTETISRVRVIAWGWWCLATIGAAAWI